MFSVARWLATAEEAVVPELPPYVLLSALAERAAEHAMVDAGDAATIEADAPRSDVLVERLFAEEPIEWNRIGHFQAVTLRLIAERLLPHGAGSTFVPSELVSQRPRR